jgi:DNA-directed RNA polymerase sigma subunit (sigma70/sigma32)
MKDGLLKCAAHCVHHKTPCPSTRCRFWIDFKKEHNCTLVSIYVNGRMTLREVGERLGLSFPRIQQIEAHALERLRNNPLAASLFF